MKRTFRIAGGLALVALTSTAAAGAATREDRAGVESLVARYTEAWNRQDRGPFSIVLAGDEAFADVLSRWTRQPGEAAQPGENRLVTRVVGTRTMADGSLTVEVAWTLGQDGGHVFHIMKRQGKAWDIVASAEPAGIHLARFR